MTRDTRIPPSDECVLRTMLDKWADRTPDKVFVVFEDGEQWTYAETRGARARQGPRRCARSA